MTPVGLVAVPATVDVTGMPEPRSSFTSGGVSASTASPAGRRAAVTIHARLWWLTLRRRWRHESATVFVALAFAGFLVLLGRAPIQPGPRGETLRFWLALANAAVMSASVGALSPAALRRLQLLPMAPRAQFAARVLFGAPLRLPLIVVVLLWTIGHLLVLPLPGARLVMEASQIVLAVMATTLVVAVLAEPGAPRWLRVVGASAFVGVGASSIAVASGRIPQWAASNGAPDIASPLTALLFGSRGDWQWEFAVVVGWALAIALLSRAGEQLAERLPDTARSSANGHGVAALLVAHFPARLRKELLLVLRTTRLRKELALVAGLSLLAFSVGAPWLLLGVIVVWLPFLCNAAGADVPLGGMTRYELMPYGVRRALAWRHAAVVLVTLAAQCVSWVTVLAVRGMPAPAGGASTRLLFAGTGFYALSLLLLLAPATAFIALRYPMPVLRRGALFAPQPAGPAALLLWLLAVLLCVTCVAFVLFAVATAVVEWASAVVPAVAHGAARLVVAGCLTLLAACAATSRSIHSER